MEIKNSIKKITMSEDDKSKMKSVSYHLKDMTVAVKKEDRFGHPLIGVRNGDGQTMYFWIGKSWYDKEWEKVHNFAKYGCKNKKAIFTNEKGDVIRFDKINVKLTMYDKCCWLVFKEPSSKIDFSVEVGEYIFDDDKYRRSKGVHITPLEEKVNDVEYVFFENK